MRDLSSEGFMTDTVVFLVSPLFHPHVRNEEVASDSHKQHEEQRSCLLLAEPVLGITGSHRTHEVASVACTSTGLLLLDAPRGRCCFYCHCTSEETEAHLEDFVEANGPQWEPVVSYPAAGEH